MSGNFLKDPDADLPYGVDWAGWLDEGETITDSQWIVPDGVTKGTDDHTGTATVVWLSGGVAGQQYGVTNRVTTSLGKVDDRTITLYVQHR